MGRVEIGTLIIPVLVIVVQIRLEQRLRRTDRVCHVLRIGVVHLEVKALRKSLSDLGLKRIVTIPSVVQEEVNNTTGWVRKEPYPWHSVRIRRRRLVVDIGRARLIQDTCGSATGIPVTRSAGIPC